MALALEICNLSKIIKHKGKEVFRLENINLNVKRGDFFALLGPNGSGKTTLITIILGLLQPDQGEVKILGKKPTDKDALTKVNFLFTDQEEPWSLKVKDILEFYANLYGIKNTKNKIAEVTALMNIQSKLDQSLHKLSSGERTRVMVARSLINDPLVLVFDEPTHNLDTYTAEKLRDFLMRLNRKGTTIIFTSHNAQEIEKMAKTIAFIKNGRIIESGSVIKLKQKYKSIKNFLHQHTS